MDNSVKKNDQPVKTAGNNQWTATHRKSSPDKRARRDGPGGEPEQDTSEE